MSNLFTFTLKGDKMVCKLFDCSDLGEYTSAPLSVPRLTCFLILFTTETEETCQKNQRTIKKKWKACDQSGIVLTGLSTAQRCRACSKHYDGRSNTNFKGQPCVYAQKGKLANCFPYNHVRASNMNVPVACPIQCAGACGTHFLLLLLLHII